MAINAFVLHGREPLFVDMGTVACAADFLVDLGLVIDRTLRWIWLTHTDFEYIGSLAPCSSRIRRSGSLPLF